MAALEYAFDSITLAAPNSLLAFCFCNVIIAILFLASPRSPNIDRERDQDTPSAPVKDTSVENDVRNWHHHDRNTAEESEALGEEVIEEASASVDVVILDCEDDEEKSDGYEKEKEEEEEDDDELRRRVEEFIAKVNRGWKAEC